MANTATLEADIRAESGKGAARTLRREGKIPAVIYGRGRDSEALVIDAAILSKLISQITSSTPVEVTVAGREPVRALIREVQRNPIRPEDILHIDLYEIHAGETIQLSVPLHLEGIPDGVRNFGGVLDQSMRELEIKVLPRHIPERVEVDVTNLGIGQAIYVGDLDVPNAEILMDPSVAVCSVIAPRAVEEETPAETLEEEAAEPEVIGKAKDEDEVDGDGDTDESS
ncbi:MAG: 50S ribosomal protein L25 [Gemmatimonadales bacterium]